MLFFLIMSIYFSDIILSELRSFLEIKYLYHVKFFPMFEQHDHSFYIFIRFVKRLNTTSEKNITQLCLFLINFVCGFCNKY